MLILFAYCQQDINRANLVMQEASDALSKTADSDTVSTYQVSSVQLVTDKCGGLSYALLKASSFLSVTNCTEET